MKHLMMLISFFFVVAQFAYSQDPDCDTEHECVMKVNGSTGTVYICPDQDFTLDVDNSCCQIKGCKPKIIYWIYSDAGHINLVGGSGGIAVIPPATVTMNSTLRTALCQGLWVTIEVWCPKNCADGPPGGPPGDITLCATLNRNLLIQPWNVFILPPPSCICANSTGYLSAGISPCAYGVSYSWEIVSGSSISLNSTTGSTISYTAASTTGVTVVKVTATDYCGTTHDFTVSINVGVASPPQELDWLCETADPCNNSSHRGCLCVQTTGACEQIELVSMYTNNPDYIVFNPNSSPCCSTGTVTGQIKCFSFYWEQGDPGDTIIITVRAQNPCGVSANSTYRYFAEDCSGGGGVKQAANEDMSNINSKLGVTIDNLFTVSPNPASTELEVNINPQSNLDKSGISRIDIISTLGIIMASQKYQPHSQFDILSLPSGEYFVRIITEKGTFIKSFIKN